MTFGEAGGSGDWWGTPLTGWGGVQIWVVWRIGRQLGVGAASRSRMERGLDAFRLLAWRPDCGCRADWTPLTGWRGVQVGDVWRIGRHLRAEAASRFLVVADLDASWVLA